MWMAWCDTTMIMIQFSCRILQHRVKVSLVTVMISVMVAAYYVDGPHQTVSNDWGYSYE